MQDCSSFLLALFRSEPGGGVELLTVFDLVVASGIGLLATGLGGETSVSGSGSLTSQRGSVTAGGGGEGY